MLSKESIEIILQSLASKSYELNSQLNSAKIADTYNNTNNTTQLLDKLNKIEIAYKEINKM